MGKFLRAALLLTILASCGYRAPPQNQDDACAIARERPGYMRDMMATERRWGVPVAVQMATIYQESGFRRGARTPYRWALGIIPMGRASSALGYAQVLNSTWDDYRSQTGRYGASRKNFRDASDFIGWYMDRSYRQAGIPKSDARDQYLAYHEGIGGYLSRSYRSKGWLIGVANRVESRAKLYNTQLLSCGWY
ncbi:lytic transglycosylase [Solirhodobacter olei]|uniref:transglycosylase SLT domain-containing protein n=1 Tax=Solirhodobacter olei TaxID=2493082 RepID=UPI000FDBC322|nr:lytic transglycosylase [Solirhodobacter olei]